MMRVHDERGSVTVWGVLIAVVLIMVIGITVDDVDAAVDYVVGVGCELTAAAQDSSWGERYAECIDPYGYAWKLFCPLPGAVNDGLDATREQWFGSNGSVDGFGTER